jgi:hypothetical protein
LDNSCWVQLLGRLLLALAVLQGLREQQEQPILLPLLQLVAMVVRGPASKQQGLCRLPTDPP